MSYDISLKDPVTNIVAEVPGHLMIGGTYKADYHPETGMFTPALNTQADLNVTYNYGHYYRDTYEKGIRAIYGKTGLESIPMLEKMIENIKEKYKENGEWITTKRTKRVYYDRHGNEIGFDKLLASDEKYSRVEDVEYEINEGDASYYWDATAANALKPLYQLIALAKMRPDCIWDGD